MRIYFCGCLLNEYSYWIPVTVSPSRQASNDGIIERDEPILLHEFLEKNAVENRIMTVMVLKRDDWCVVLTTYANAWNVWLSYEFSMLWLSKRKVYVLRQHVRRFSKVIEMWYYCDSWAKPFQMINLYMFNQIDWISKLGTTPILYFTAC